MSLKELYELNDADILYETVGAYLIKTASYRLAYNFEEYLEEVDICPICGEVNERDEMVFHKWDIGQVEEMICESCRNDE